MKHDAIAVETPAAIHASAVIALGSHLTGLALAFVLVPEMALDLALVGRGAFLLIGSFAAFIAIVSWLQRQMGVALTASKTVTPPRLCTTGPFAMTRNPIYLAFVLPLAAIAVYSPLAAVIAIVLYAAATTHYVVVPEEARLARLFGPAYQDYCGRTPRWLFV